MSRYTRDNDRRPFRFDPDQRARDFTRKRKRRGRSQPTQTIERRVTDLETYSYLSTRIAIQPPANSRIQVVTVLPEATALDIGRQLLVRSPAAVRDVLYIGMQQSDGTVVWVQWTSSYEGGGGEPVDDVEVSVSFVKHIPLAVAPRGCHATTGYVYFSYDGGSNLRRYDRTSGAITTLTFPGALQPNGIYAQDDGKIWVAVEASASVGSIRYWNGSSAVVSPATDIVFFGIAYNAVNDTINAAGHVDLASSSGRVRRVNKTTLVQSAVASPSSTYYSFGIAVDSGGFVYNSGAKTASAHAIYKRNPDLTYLEDFNGSGSTQGSFTFPRGMAFDSSDRLYVADAEKDRVQIFNTDGESLGTFGVGGTGAGQFNEAWDVTIHGTTLWVADHLNQRLSEWTINS